MTLRFLLRTDARRIASSFRAWNGGPWAAPAGTPAFTECAIPKAIFESVYVRFIPENFSGIRVWWPPCATNWPFEALRPRPPVHGSLPENAGFSRQQRLRAIGPRCGQGHREDGRQVRPDLAAAAPPRRQQLRFPATSFIPLRGVKSPPVQSLQFRNTNQPCRGDRKTGPVQFRIDSAFSCPGEGSLTFIDDRPLDHAMPPDLDPVHQNAVDDMAVGIDPGSWVR